MAKGILLDSKMWQRQNSWNLEGDIWTIEFILYNNDHDPYMRIMEFPVKKWSRQYKLKKLGI